MRHNINKRKLNRTSSHRKAMLSNMSISLIMHEQIKTTLSKAKELRPYIEKLLTQGKKNNLVTYRSLLAKINNESAAKKIVDVLSVRYLHRNGGYTRIIKAGFRYGDRAPVAYIEFVDRDESSKGLTILKNNQK